MYPYPALQQGGKDEICGKSRATQCARTPAICPPLLRTCPLQAPCAPGNRGGGPWGPRGGPCGGSSGRIGPRGPGALLAGAMGGPGTPAGGPKPPSIFQSTLRVNQLAWEAGDGLQSLTGEEASGMGHGQLGQKQGESLRGDRTCLNATQAEKAALLAGRGESSARQHSGVPARALQRSCPLARPSEHRTSLSAKRAAHTALGVPAPASPVPSAVSLATSLQCPTAGGAPELHGRPAGRLGAPDG